MPAERLVAQVVEAMESEQGRQTFEVLKLSPEDLIQKMKKGEYASRDYRLLITCGSSTSVGIGHGWCG